MLNAVCIYNYVLLRYLKAQKKVWLMYVLELFMPNAGDLSPLENFA